MRGYTSLVCAVLIAIVGGCTIRDGKFFLDIGSPRTVAPKDDPAKKHILRVLIVYSLADRMGNMSPSQRSILTSGNVRKWMKTHCSKDADGEPEFRCWADTDDVSNEPEIWKKTLARHRDTPNYFYVENESTGTEGPLPEDEDRLFSILEPFTKGE